MVSRARDWLRAHPRAAWGAAAGALAAVSFGAGRYMAPTKVETREVVKTETVEVVRWRDRTVTERGPVVVREHRVEVPGPAGPTVTVDRVVEREKVITVRDQAGEAASATSSERVVEKLVEREAPRLLLGAGGGIRWEGPVAGQASLVAGVRVLGPGWLILTGATDLPATWPPRGSVTANVAVTF